jgi:hypothetical protein
LITFKPTTPVLSKPPFTLAPEIVCEEIAAECQEGASLIKTCNEEYGFYTALSKHPKLESCLCKPEILSMQSVCIYDGDVSCRGISTKVSDLNLWEWCPVSDCLYQRGSHNSHISQTDICASSIGCPNAWNTDCSCAIAQAHTTSIVAGSTFKPEAATTKLKSQVFYRGEL